MKRRKIMVFKCIRIIVNTVEILRDDAFCLNGDLKFASSVLVANTGFTKRFVHNLWWSKDHRYTHIHTLSLCLSHKHTQKQTSVHAVSNLCPLL